MGVLTTLLTRTGEPLRVRLGRLLLTGWPPPAPAAGAPGTGGHAGAREQGPVVSREPGHRASGTGPGRDGAFLPGGPARSPRPVGPGRVALVGGGPGDPELLTERARELLGRADVVLADRLAPRDYERICPRAEVIDVGKAPGRHALDQEDINRLLVERARSGQRVVRLKGGDPFVFGRGVEERIACEKAGVSVEVVPGITSALAGPAAAGIPLTHRGLAGGFSVVEGHDLRRSLIANALPGGRDHTLVVLMGVRTLAATASLLAAGTRGAHCPVAVIERATTPAQRVTVATLGTIAEVAGRVGVANPAVIVVGDVVTLSPRWPEVHRRGAGLGCRAPALLWNA